MTQEKLYRFASLEGKTSEEIQGILDETNYLINRTPQWFKGIHDDLAARKAECEAALRGIK